MCLRFLFLVIPCIPKLPSVPAFRSSHLTSTALLAVLKALSVLLEISGSYVLTEFNRKAFQLFFSPCQSFIFHSILPCTLPPGLFKMY